MRKKPRRPALRWHGGKWILAPWIIKHFAKHRTYTETFGGAASVLLRKDRSHGEVYNDLDDIVVKFFRVLRDPAQAERLIRALEMTPFARSEFDAAYEVSDDPVEEARRLVVRSFMGYGSDGFNREVRTGFRANSNRSGNTPARDWCNIPPALEITAERIRGVIIECRPADQVLAKHDGPESLHYVDPPYLPETRSTKERKGGRKYHAYRHELSTRDHEELLRLLRELEGMVCLSGYPHELYDDLLPGWQRIARKAYADGAKEATECLWLNPALQQARAAGPLFSGEKTG